MEWIVLAAVVLDLILGDPGWLPHPVVGMGRVITLGEKTVRRLTSSPRGLKLGGLLLSLILVFGTYWFFWALIRIGYQVNHYLGLGLSVLVMSQALAVNSLYKHATAVFIPLKEGNLSQARQALSRIVGRDTDHLDEREIVRGTVETVAENTVDGITAPLFFGFLGGPPLAMAYKAISTLDSMLGYKNEKYLHLGWAGARLDDAANYIPARLTAVLYLISAPFTPGGLRGVLGTIRKDAGRHPSPNSGIPEAATAGALQVQLGGTNYYGGARSERALIGQDKKVLSREYIRHSLALMLAVSLEAVVLGVLACRLIP
jgi:adenosylcobinamide-phosphate synthase